MTTRLRRALPVLLTVVFLAVAVTVVVKATGNRGPGGDETATSATATPTSIPPPPPPVPPSPCPPRPTDRSGTRDGVLRIGTMFPLTGARLGSYGPALTAAAQLAAKDVQDVTGSAGIPGAGRVELGPETDEGEPGSAAACGATDALLAGGVDAVVGPFASVNTLNVYQRVTGRGALMVSPANTLTGLSLLDDDRGLYFRTTSTNAVQGAAIADFVATDQKKNVAMVVSNETFASDLAGATVGALRGRQVNVTELRYDSAQPLDAQFATIADEITSGRFDGVVFFGFYEIAGLVSRLIDKGLLPRNFGMYGGTGFVINDFARAASRDRAYLMEGFSGFVPWAEGSFNLRLQAGRPSGAPLTDLTYAAQAFDAVVVTALAATAAGSDDPAAIARQLPLVTRGGQPCGSYAECVALLRANPAADIDYNGVSGPLGFTPQGDLCQGRFLLSAFGPTGLLDVVRRDVTTSGDQCG